MPFLRRVCTNNSKTMLLRIVHASGRVELHDKPVTAAEIMSRNPRCRVTYPNVFQQPWAIVEPETMLMLGQKFYLVPMNTIRKLQSLSPRNSPSAYEITFSSSVEEIRYMQSSKEEEDDGMLFICCVFRNKRIAKQSNNKQNSKNKNKSKIKSNVRNLSLNVNDKNGDSWFASLFNAADMTKETRTSSTNTHLCDGNTPTRKRTRDLTGTGLTDSPKKAWSVENWQPSLESITEE